ncbi:TetR/AcrR family transcriptional regulator [Atopomonas sediminilitoris]|uniref:TetR/AcrR family transcriptional regulator n=1 Tax=Atopomonas sediminilitoris TaxID=2919919 RepID=UPI001F4E9515|nr:TetR/AcrR family transcriptional regulator [Atopomonas sediminilitoris]MCJ8170412.1 TetR/AcrR family transcriptional regulator [Atopomonas sediminilitoris]
MCADQPRPKTRERILLCAQELFNRMGEPQVTTLEIANELEISPGNLYYHFRGKEPLILALFERFQNDTQHLLEPPVEAELLPDDYWLFLHLIVEQTIHYRFLFQDLSVLAERMPKLAHGMRQWINRLKQAIALLLAKLKAEDVLTSELDSLGSLVEQLTMTLLYSLEYQRMLGQPSEARIAVFQIMMLVAPHLTPAARHIAEGMAKDYLA